MSITQTLNTQPSNHTNILTHLILSQPKLKYMLGSVLLPEPEFTLGFVHNSEVVESSWVK